MNATANRRPRALLLDDDPTVLRLLGTALEARGLDVRAALDAASGIELLTDELLDLPWSERQERRSDRRAEDTEPGRDQERQRSRQQRHHPKYSGSPRKGLAD